MQLADNDFDRSLAELGRPFGWHDFRQYDLDAPFPDVLHVAELSFRTQAEKIVAAGPGQRLHAAGDRATRCPRPGRPRSRARR